MKLFQKHKLTFVSITYWFLLIYIIAALCWWFIALNHQNGEMTRLSLSDIPKDVTNYNLKVEEIVEKKNRKTTQYIGEGITFLVVILVSAGFIYRATRRQIKFADSQQNFMMAVTHELKTPIAITQLNLETIKKRNLSKEQQEKIINDSLKEVARLNNLCNNSLWAAQLDAGSYREKKERINLSQIIKEAGLNYQKNYTNTEINSNIEEDIYIEGDILMIEILINNLIENAIKYSPKDSQIIIHLQKEKKKIVLNVTDFGVAISDEEKNKVFEKFYRSNHAKVKNISGSGLGLFLCKKIMQKHQGEIKVLNNQPNGSVFKATFNV